MTVSREMTHFVTVEIWTLTRPKSSSLTQNFSKYSTVNDRSSGKNRSDPFCPFKRSCPQNHWIKQAIFPLNWCFFLTICALKLCPLNRSLPVSTWRLHENRRKNTAGLCHEWKKKLFGMLTGSKFSVTTGHGGVKDNSQGSEESSWKILSASVEPTPLCCLRNTDNRSGH